MTTIPTTRPVVQGPARPAAQPASAGVVPSIDPIKLLKKSKWLPPAAAAAGLVSAGILGESNFIRLSFWWTDPDEATAILKVVGKAYMSDLVLMSQGDISERRNLLVRAIGNATNDISQAQTKRTRLLQEQNVETLE